MPLRNLSYEPDRPGPLEGVRVIDMSRLVAGNMLSLQLADYGAEVLKIEEPVKGDTLRAWRVNGHSLFWKVYARNKKSVTLNLKNPAGRQALLRLAETADILIEGFKPGYLEAIGLGPAELHAANPRLVIVRVSGFGQSGPYSSRPGFGTLVEAMSGFAASNGFADREPVLPPLAMADMIAGLYGAMAALVAYREVENGKGGGQVVDLSLLDSMVSILGPLAAEYLITGHIRERVGSASHISVPRGVYRTQDDKWVAISGSTQAMTERLFRAIGRADMLDDPRFQTNSDRLRHRAEIDAVISGWMGERSQEDCLRILGSADVTAGPVYDISQFVTDPHVEARPVVAEFPDEDFGRIAMHPVTARLSATPGTVRTPAPQLGEHNQEIFGPLGYGADEISALQTR